MNRPHVYTRHGSTIHFAASPASTKTLCGARFQAGSEVRDDVTCKQCLDRQRLESQRAEYLRHVAARAIEGCPLSIPRQEIVITMAVDAYEHGDEEVPGSDGSGSFGWADIALKELRKVGA